VRPSEEWAEEKLKQKFSPRATYPFTPEMRNSDRKRGNMCPACVASTVAMVAGVGSTGGILAVGIAKLRKFFSASGLALLQKTFHKM
jgi:hypothetical protein